MTERTINAERVEQLIDVFGSFDENVKKIEQAFGVHITNRNTELKVTRRKMKRPSTRAQEPSRRFWR